VDIQTNTGTGQSIDVTNLAFAYPGGEPILKNISFTARTGQIISILGPNGSGKTTLLNCLANLEPLSAGTVCINGRRIDRMAPRQVARAVGYIPQVIVPSFAFTVIDYVVTGCAPYMGTFEKPAEKHYEIAYEAVRHMGIEHLAQRSYMHVSGGERQQIAIARALAQRPAFILMDEPVAHLDYGNQIKVLKTVRRLASEGLGILLTTHNPDHALLLGGDAAVLSREGTIHFGPGEKILNQEFLTELYGTELKLVYIDSLSRNVCAAPML
jgi:iron complex transport system ATP-binding protein